MVVPPAECAHHLRSRPSAARAALVALLLTSALPVVGCGSAGPPPKHGGAEAVRGGPAGPPEGGAGEAGGPRGGEQGAPEAAGGKGGPGAPLGPVGGGPGGPEAPKGGGGPGGPEASKGGGDPAGAQGATGADPAEAAGPKPGLAGDEGAGVSNKAKALSNERVLASARGRIRACTEDGLYRKPSMAGRVQFALTVGGNGSVSQATLTRSGTVDDGVVACIRRVLQGLHFDPPESGTSTVNGSFKVVNASQY